MNNARKGIKNAIKNIRSTKNMDMLKISMFDCNKINILIENITITYC